MSLTGVADIHTFTLKIITLNICLICVGKNAFFLNLLDCEPD